MYPVRTCTGINNFLNTLSWAVVQMSLGGRADGCLTSPVLTFRPSCPILGPVTWTINVSHTPLGSGGLWNHVTMLLKSEKGREREKKLGGRGVVFGVFVARGGVLTCVNGASVAWGRCACAWVWCVLCCGIFPDPISTVRICTEEIQCEMRHRCSRREERPVPNPPPPPDPRRQVGSRGVGGENCH